MSENLAVGQVNISSDLNKIRGLGGAVVRPLAARAESGVRFPDRPSRSEIYFSDLYVRRSWFTGIVHIDLIYYSLI